MYDRVIWPERCNPRTSAIYALNDRPWPGAVHASTLPNAAFVRILPVLDGRQSALPAWISGSIALFTYNLEMK